MSHRIFIHLAAIRRQLRRAQHTSVLNAGVLLLSAAFMLTTPRTGLLSLILLFLLGFYLLRKVRWILWTRSTIKQLRLEEQFVRHGPAPGHVLTCTRRHNHLWARSLTLRGLQTLIKKIPPYPLPEEAQYRHVRRQYFEAFSPLRPSSFPTDLICFAVMAMFWLWSVPETLLQSMAPPVFIAAALLMLMLVAEVIQAVLCSDLRSGVEHCATLLSDWTLAQSFNEVIRTTRQKPYRHHALYRSSTPALTPLFS